MESLFSAQRKIKAAVRTAGLCLTVSLHCLPWDRLRLFKYIFHGHSHLSFQIWGITFTGRLIILYNSFTMYFCYDQHLGPCCLKAIVLDQIQEVTGVRLVGLCRFSIVAAAESGSSADRAQQRGLSRSHEGFLHLMVCCFYLTSVSLLVSAIFEKSCETTALVVNLIHWLNFNTVDIIVVLTLCFCWIPKCAYIIIGLEHNNDPNMWRSPQILDTSTQITHCWDDDTLFSSLK